MKFRFKTMTTRRGSAISVVTVPAFNAGLTRAPVLLVHPINMRKECWLGVLPALAAQRDCVLLDLSGHGDSSDGDFSLAGWVSDCVDVVDGLALNSLHVVGGSLGGAIALGLAASLPERVLSVTGLGSSIESASPRTQPPAPVDGPAVDSLFADLAQEAVGPDAPEDVIESIRQLTNRHGADVVSRVLHAAYDADATEWVSTIDCPALWMAGEHDVTCPPALNEHIAANLRGVAIVLDDVGHLPMIEDPELVIRHLRLHLDGAERATSRG